MEIFANNPPPWNVNMVYEWPQKGAGFFGVEKQILLHLFCIHKSRSPTKYKSESSETGTVAKDNRQRKKKYRALFRQTVNSFPSKGVCWSMHAVWVTLF